MLISNPSVTPTLHNDLAHVYPVSPASHNGLVHVQFALVALLQVVQPASIADLLTGHVDERPLLLPHHVGDLIASVPEVEVVSSLPQADRVVNLDHVLALKSSDWCRVASYDLANLWRKFKRLFNLHGM